MMRSCLHIAYGWDEGDEVRVYVSERKSEGGGGSGRKMELRNEWKVRKCVGRKRLDIMQPQARTMTHAHQSPEKMFT